MCINIQGTIRQQNNEQYTWKILIEIFKQKVKNFAKFEKCNNNDIFIY